MFFQNGKNFPHLNGKQAENRGILHINFKGNGSVRYDLGDLPEGDGIADQLLFLKSRQNYFVFREEDFCLNIFLFCQHACGNRANYFVSQLFFDATVL